MHIFSILFVYFSILELYKSTNFIHKGIWGINKYPQPSWSTKYSYLIKDNLVYSVQSTIIPLATQSKNCVKRPNYIPKPNHNIFNFDKGHIISLDLGGINHVSNIISQPCAWQRYGYWRKLERFIKYWTLRIYQWEKPVCAENAWNTTIANDIVMLNYTLYYNEKNYVTLYNGTMKWQNKHFFFAIKPQLQCTFIEFINSKALKRYSSQNLL